MKKNNIKTKVIGTVLATICAVSAGTAITAVSASAATVNTSYSVSANRVKACTITVKCIDWDYRADSKSAKITCEYNSKTGTHTFKATGSFAGVTHAVLKYQTADRKWHNMPVTYTVDKYGNVQGKQTAKEYITNDRFSG